uniref:SCP domain-containing protein n=1 Tax=Mesocestoides corti TaxID=53468 RepID=A0A5K3FXH5_MESCO
MSHEASGRREANCQQHANANLLNRNGKTGGKICCQLKIPDSPEFEHLKNYGFIAEFVSEGESLYSDLFCTVNGSDYSHADNDCKSDCYNYKQMVLANVTQIGCALHPCPSSSGNSKTEIAIACGYNAISDDRSGRPYEEGVSCSKCPEGYGCNRNQCDAKSLSQATTTSGASGVSSLTIFLSAVLIVLCLL